MECWNFQVEQHEYYGQLLRNGAGLNWIFQVAGRAWKWEKISRSNLGTWMKNGRMLRT